MLAYFLPAQPWLNQLSLRIPHRLSSFRYEAQTGQKWTLCDQWQLPFCREIFMTHEHLAIAMEYVPGGDLFAYVRQASPSRCKLYFAFIHGIFIDTIFSKQASKDSFRPRLEHKHNTCMRSIILRLLSVAYIYSIYILTIMPITLIAWTVTTSVQQLPAPCRVQLFICICNLTEDAGLLWL